MASNSGRTKEVTLLAKKLKEEGNALRFGLTANQDTILSTFCAETHVLNCGWEQAVAATKSVVEQALYYESVLWNMAGKDVKAGLAALPAQIEQALTLQVPAEIVDWVKKAETIYFAGYNDGVAEELTLKTNEITRRKSDFLEGTYALHGIEEVMKEGDIIFWVDPIARRFRSASSRAPVSRLWLLPIMTLRSRPSRLPQPVISILTYICAQAGTCWLRLVSLPEWIWIIPTVPAR